MKKGFFEQLKERYSIFSSNKMYLIGAAIVIIFLIATFVFPYGPTAPSKSYHVKTWTELMAERNATKVTRNVQLACDLLYKSGNNTYDLSGIRCVRNNFYLDKTCGPDKNQFCDCICYIS